MCLVVAEVGTPVDGTVVSFCGVIVVAEKVICGAVVFTLGDVRAVIMLGV